MSVAASKSAPTASDLVKQVQEAVDLANKPEGMIVLLKYDVCHCCGRTAIMAYAMYGSNIIIQPAIHEPTEESVTAFVGAEVDTGSFIGELVESFPETEAIDPDDMARMREILEEIHATVGTYGILIIDDAVSIISRPVIYI